MLNQALLWQNHRDIIKRQGNGVKKHKDIPESWEDMMEVSLTQQYDSGSGIG